MAAPTPAPVEPTPVALRPTAEPIAPPTARPAPTVPLGTGDVQVTLRWSSDTYLDLHVIDPAGVEISFGNRTAPSGGQLDFDDVPQPGDDGPHVENIFWEVGTAPPGAYQAWVDHFSGSPSAYTLEVRVDGTLVHSEEGTLSPGESSTRVPFAR